MKHAESDAPSELERARAIFFPYVAQRRAELAKRKIRLAHYCSAASAVSIIRHQEIWMRNAAVMNDYTEVEYGMQLLLAAYEGKAGAAFQKAIDEAFPQTAARVTHLFNSYRWELRGETYLTSVSEHLPDENAMGRLSMWRSYGGNAGVALVLQPDAMSAAGESLAGFALPVLYADQAMFERYMRELADSISDAREFIREQGQDWFVNWLHFLLRSIVLSTKHPGFGEEREWRVIHSPMTVKSDFVKPEILTVADIPQIVYKLPLGKAAHAADGAPNIASLVERIIIGPARHPMVMQAAFVELLAEAGVPQPADRVGISAIPLRQA